MHRCVLRGFRQIAYFSSSRYATTRARPCMASGEQYKFGPHVIRESEIFLATDLSFAFVNLKPVLPGHVLISPKRIVRRFKDLSPEEVGDVWSLAQRVGAGLESHLKVDSLTLAIQDGPAAGQTVPHVHIHCLPRRFGDFENNDDVYDAIDESSKVSRDPQKLDLDKPRVVRGPEEMAEEAAEFRKLFEQ